MTTWHDRLASALKARGLGYSDLVRATGLSRPSVYAWAPNATKRTKDLKGTNLSKVCALLGVTPAWLLNGVGRDPVAHQRGDKDHDTARIENDLPPSSNIPHGQSPLESNVSPGPDVRGRVPLISWVQAGVWNEAVDIYEPGYAEDWLPVLRNGSPHSYALRVQGDSMTAPHGRSYPEGTIIIVDPEQRSPSSGQRIIAKLVGTNAVTFKVFVDEDGKRWLKPLNPLHEPIRDEFRVLGTVIAKYEPE